MNETPKSNRIHIGIFGRCNVGKSTLMNALLGQDLAIVSSLAGTTTDCVQKNIEWNPIGPVVLIDTAGIDDTSELGGVRVKKTRRLLKEVDFCLWVVDKAPTKEELTWLEELKKKQMPYLVVYNNKKDNVGEADLATILENYQMVDISHKESIQGLKDSVSELIGKAQDRLCIGDKVSQGDIVVLVAPQDIQAPKGRLILPQVQVTRELLDKKAIPILTTPETLEYVLETLKEKPKWVITDSQVFKYVADRVPKDIKLTSFSIIMGRAKGELDTFREGADAIEELKDGDCILIAESCTHNPLHGDIAREKIPQALKKRVGKKLHFEWTSGKSFPEDLSKYSLIIQCGGCMHTPRQIQYRIDLAKEQHVPITNFGVCLAKLSGVRVDY